MKRVVESEGVKDRYLVAGNAFQRIMKEYDEHGTLHIGYDFDGTIHDFHKAGDTYPALLKLLRNLKSIGCHLYCWTAYEDLTYVENYLKEHDIPFDGINCDGIPLKWKSRKPFFSALLDDRAGLREVYGYLNLLVSNVQFKKTENENNSTAAD